MILLSNKLQKDLVRNENIATIVFHEENIEFSVSVSD
jgi:hypothetical protein